MRFHIVLLTFNFLESLFLYLFLFILLFSSILLKILYNRDLKLSLFQFESFYLNEILMNILNIQIHYFSIFKFSVIPNLIYQNSLHIKINIIKVYFHKFTNELRLQSSLISFYRSDNHI